MLCRHNLNMEIIEPYEDGYSSEHSLFLQDHFDISNRGVDFYNSLNVSFEFKECWAKPKYREFKISQKQLEESDFTIFCVYHNQNKKGKVRLRDLKKSFYVVENLFLLESYSFNTFGKRVNLRVTTIEKICSFETKNIEDLKKYVLKLEY